MKMFATIAFLAVLLLIGGVSAAQQVTLSNAQVNGLSGTQTVTMVLDQAPTGLSGYTITLTVADPSKARIKSWQGPAWASLWSNGTLPASSGWVQAAAFTTTQVPSGSTDIQLGTATIEGLSSGTTTITATLTYLDDNSGGNYIPTTTINPGTIDVYAIPEAGFAANTITPIVSETVTFTDQSTGNPASWAWDFGDGTTSTLQSPTHAYTTTGLKTVSLTVTNPAGTDTETKTDYINVVSQPVPVAAFSATPVYGTAPLSVTFTDASTNSPTSWNWESRACGTSGSWTSFSTVQSPTYSFAAGAYDVRLTATNGGGSNTVTQTQYISSSAGARRLTTVQSGTVSGDIYVGAFGGLTGTTGATNTYEQTYTLPAAAVGNVQWARLYTVVYGSSTDARAGTATVSFDGNGDSAYETVLGTETLATGSTNAADVYPVNNHVDKQYTDYQIQYDVTSLITSASPKAKVVATPIASNFDARTKDLVLVVAYNDGDSDVVRYWVNDGLDFQSAVSPGPVTSTFATNGLTSGITSATLQNVGLSSADAAYNFTGNPIIPTGTVTNQFVTNVWDVKSLLAANLGSNSNMIYERKGTSYKTTLAALKARYVTAPTAAFTSSPTGTVAVSQDVAFTSTSTLPNTNIPATYAWVFGDGATSTVQNPTHAYTAAGTYTVTLIVTNEGGSSTATSTVVVSDKPIISFVPVSQTILPSGTTTYVIQMDNAPNGLSGYDMYVSLADATVADITAVSYDSSWAQMTMSPTVPADSIRIGAVDAGQKIYPGTTGPYTLATITVRGTAAGTSGIVLSALNMDDDSGNAIDATLNTGAVTVSSSTAPVAAFSGTPASGASPLTVTFTDASTSSSGAITDWAWDFGDGTTSTIQNPTHTYSVGIYTVKLTVTAPGGTDTEIKTSYIVSGDAAPAADFTATPTAGLYPMTVTFTDASAGNVSTYYWNFGDGTYSALENPVHTYTWPGTFTVSLTVTGPGGSDTETKTSLINTNVQAPDADFSASPTTGLNPLHVFFTDQSTGNLTGITYAWNFGDGATSTAQNPDHTYTADGLYTVSLAITTVNGADTETKTSLINVGGNMAVAFTGTPTSGVASRKVPLYVAFTDATAGSPTAWTWDFGNSNATGNALQNPTTTYWGRPAKYTVTLTASSGADAGSLTRDQYITVTPYLEKFLVYNSAHVITGYMTSLPADLNGDNVYEDINGNGRVDYNDVVTFYNAILGPDYWVQDVTLADFENFDYSGNGAIGYNDVVALNDQVIYT
jgi:PKD repeat protein